MFNYGQFVRYYRNVQGEVWQVRGVIIFKSIFFSTFEVFWDDDSLISNLTSRPGYRGGVGASSGIQGSTFGPTNYQSNENGWSRCDGRCPQGHDCVSFYYGSGVYAICVSNHVED